MSFRRRGAALAPMRAQGTGDVVTLPAPTGGLNTRDSLSSLQPNEARLLENWLVETAGCRRRPGYDTHATGAGTDVQTLHIHRGTTTKYLAGSGGSIYDVTSSTASSLATGYTENRWQTEYYNGYSFFVNGTDTPFRYDGSTVAATGFTGTGLTLTDLANVALVRDRLWFCEEGSPSAWYGPIAGVTGTLTEFDLGQVTRGGYCMAIGSWSQDAGDGPDDYTVFVMSTGQNLVYSGDPASTFSLVGKFEGPRPVGRRCIIRYGGEIVILTVSGLISGTSLLSGKAFDPAAMQTLGKVAPSFADDFELHGSRDGWHGVQASGLIYVNVPQGVTSKQYVYNTRLGTWSTFYGLPVSAMAVDDGALYFGGLADGTVWQHTGSTDNGSSILTRARPAFVQPSRGRSLVTAFRPVLVTDTEMTGRFVVDADYETNRFGSSIFTFGVAGGTTPWGSAWGSEWGRRNRASRQWRSATGSGFRIAYGLELSGGTGDLSWTATDLMVRSGNAL